MPPGVCSPRPLPKPGEGRNRPFGRQTLLAPTPPVPGRPRPGPHRPSTRTPATAPASGPTPAPQRSRNRCCPEGRAGAGQAVRYAARAGVSGACHARRAGPHRVLRRGTAALRPGSARPGRSLRHGRVCRPPPRHGDAVRRPPPRRGRRHAGCYGPRRGSRVRVAAAPPVRPADRWPGRSGRAGGGARRPDVSGMRPDFLRAMSPLPAIQSWLRASRNAVRCVHVPAPAAPGCPGAVVRRA